MKDQGKRVRRRKRGEPNMDKKVFEELVGDQQVTLVYTTGFRLSGFVRRLYDTSFIFETTQKLGAISYDRIKEIYPVGRNDEQK